MHWRLLQNKIRPRVHFHTEQECARGPVQCPFQLCVIALCPMPSVQCMLECVLYENIFPTLQRDESQGQFSLICTNVATPDDGFIVPVAVSLCFILIIQCWASSFNWKGKKKKNHWTIMLNKTVFRCGSHSGHVAVDKRKKILNSFTVCVPFSNCILN